MIVGNIYDIMLTHANIVCGGMLASVNSVKKALAGMHQDGLSKVGLGLGLVLGLRLRLGLGLVSCCQSICCYGAR